MRRRRVAVLGATGMVGQSYLLKLEQHPWFEVVALAASPRSAGRRYLEAASWVQQEGIPAAFTGMELLPPSAAAIRASGAELVFSALPSEAARELESELATSGLQVVAATAAHRMDPEVPLVIPEVNGEAVSALSGPGYIVSSPNCSTIGLAMTLAPLQRHLGLSRVCVTTLQAVSGAGYRGVPSMAILDNVVPYIANEEEKIRRETHKILGADFEIYAQCTRVPVLAGHLETVFAELAAEVELPRLRELITDLPALGLPSSPERPLLLREETDRPQTRLDREAGGGMTTSLGRLRLEGRMLRYVLLSHNTVRGAAGNAILIAELLVSRGLA